MTKNALPFFTSLFLSLFLSINLVFAEESQTIKLATTTSTENSGLLKFLLPEFNKDTHYNVHVIAVGTGKALRMGRDGDVDVLLVHALKAEQKFIVEGYGVKRFSVMYNDFVIVGPKEDSAKLANAKTAAEALDKISNSKARFISRGDDSGTHKKELGLWKEAKNQPDSKKDQWYLEAGQGMGKVLQIAGEMDAYTLTDRSTWLAFKSKSSLKIVFEGNSELFNPYGIIAISPQKHPDVNKAGAKALIDWITSDKGQHLIGQFKISGKTLFTPSTAAIASIEFVAK